MAELDMASTQLLLINPKAGARPCAGCAALPLPPAAPYLCHLLTSSISHCHSMFFGARQVWC